MRGNSLHGRRPFRIPHVHPATNRLKRAMAQISLRVLCEDIYGVRKRDGYYFSPVRNDGQNPAFEIRPDGEVGIDHATGEGFNALTLIERVENLTRAEARQRLIFYAESIPGCLRPISSLLGPSRPLPLEMPDRELFVCNWPSLGWGTADDYIQYGNLRGLNPVALLIATSLRLFFFLIDKHSGQRLCTVTDDARYVRQDRCIDGSEVILYGGGTSKNRTIGAGSWPVGAANIGSRSTVLVVEGMPDLLAAVQVVEAQRRHHDTAVVAMLGAKQRIHPTAIPHFSGKRIRLFPHTDQRGAQAAVCWMRQLQRVAREIDTFCFAEPTFAGQEPVKDLNDFIVVGGQSRPDLIPAAKAKGGAGV